MDKWTKKEIETHIEANVDDYSTMVVVGALFKKLYGVYPKVGLSGFQANCIDQLLEKLPERLEGAN